MTHHSKDYVQMIYKFLKDRQEAQKFWRQFLRLGEEFQIGDLDIQRSLELQEKFKAMPRACYYNAAQIAMRMTTGMDYMEGIATSVIPTEHAWLVDRTWNRVIDVTWIKAHQRARKPEYKIKDYFGVRVPLTLVSETWLNTEMAGPMLWLVMDQLKETKRRKRLVER